MKRAGVDGVAAVLPAYGVRCELDHGTYRAPTRSSTPSHRILGQ
jgi:hypothetical protein